MPRVGHKTTTFTWLAAHYHASNGVPFQQLTVNSRDGKQYVWELDCHKPQHTRVLRLKSLLGTAERQGAYNHPPSTLHCYMCNCRRVQGPRRGPSQHELKLYEKLARCPTFYSQFRPECKLLLEHFGAVDVFLPECGVAIMVDGEHHFPNKQGHHTRGTQEQMVSDLCFDAKVLAGGGRGIRGLVRLHYKDSKLWLEFIEKAVAHARNASVRVFVIYSASYYRDLGYQDAIYY